jgi:t-SNARE complex subunit (syntaxin)
MSFEAHLRGDTSAPSLGGRVQGAWGSNKATNSVPIEDFTGNEGNIVERATQIIQKISKNTTQIKQIAERIGTPKDNLEKRQQMHQLIEETRHLAHDASELIKHFETRGNLFEEKAKRVQQQKLLKDLKQWLAQFQETVKFSGQREKAYPLQQRASQQPSNSTDFQLIGEEDHNPFQREEEERKHLAVQNELEYNEAIIRDREEGIKEIEKTVKEVNEIFIDLSNLVVEQGEMIDNIESNVEASVVDTSKGTEELVTASKYQKKARTKMCLLALILIVVAAAAVLVIYFFFKQ